jgi:hypothetical protein
VRIGLVTEGGYPYVGGDAGPWCDRLVRGLGQHEFDLYALSRSRWQENEGWVPLPPHVTRVRTAPLWTAEDDGAPPGRRARRRFTECYGELAQVVCATQAASAGREARAGEAANAGQAASAGEAASAGRPAHIGRTAPDTPARERSADLADRFASALYGLAELARDTGGLTGALRSETAVRALDPACRAPRAPRAARTAPVPDPLAAAAHRERARRPLSLD